MGNHRGRHREYHLQVYRRDRWQCRMPVCLHVIDGQLDRGIDPALRGTDNPWAPSIDHVIPLFLGGADRPGNMRAAHRWCNQQQEAYQGGPPAEPLTNNIGELFPQLGSLPS